MFLPMRRIGKLLSLVGAAVGVLMGLALLTPVHLTGFAWLIAVGLTKLTFAVSLGLIGGGAVLQRIANQRAAAQLSLPDPTERP